MKHNLLLVPGLIALGACGQEPSTAENRPAEVPIDTASFSVPAALQPGAFVSAVAASDMFEIESSRLALDKATAEPVRKYAQQMIDAHTKSSANLKTAAQAAGQSVNPVLAPEQQGNLRMLRGAAETEFDRLYVDRQIAAHEEALRMLEGYTGTAPDDALAAFARKTAPIVRGHLDMARQINTAR